MPTKTLAVLIVHVLGMLGFALPLLLALIARLRAQDLAGRRAAATRLTNSRTPIALSMGVMIFSGLLLNYIAHDGFQWSPTLKTALEVVLWGSWGLSEIVVFPRLQSAQAEAAGSPAWQNAETRTWRVVGGLLILTGIVAGLSTL